MKSKNRKYISHGIQAGLIKNEDIKLGEIARITEIELDGNTLLLHRDDNITEIWIENKFCKRCNNYHNELPYCSAPSPRSE